MNRGFFKRLLCLLLCLLLAVGPGFAIHEEAYTIKAGDTVFAISLKYKVPLSRLLEYNGLTEAQASSLLPGHVLYIPNDTSATTYQEQMAAASLEEQYVTAKGEATTEVNVVSFNFVEANLEYVLRLIAEAAGTRILYLGQPRTVTASVGVVSPLKALGAVTDALGDLGYTVDGDVIIVGPKNKISSVFATERIEVSVRLSVLNAEALSALLQAAGLENVQVYTAAGENGKVTLRARPRNIAAALDLIRHCDSTAYFNMEDLQLGIIEAAEQPLYSLTAENLEDYLKLVGLQVTVLPMSGRDNRVVLFGRKEELVKAQTLADWVNTEYNVPQKDNTLNYAITRYRSDNLTAAQVLVMVGALGEHFYAIADQSTGEGDETVCLVGSRSVRAAAVMVLGTVEQELLTTGVLHNVSTILSARGEQGKESLKKVQETLIDATGIQADRFIITENLAAAGADPVYLLVARGTTGEIQRIRAAEALLRWDNQNLM